MKPASLSVCQLLCGTALSLCLFCASNRESRIFYVDPTHGNDGNNGELSAPFQTLTKALDVVRGRVDSGFVSDSIYLRKGVYRNHLSETIFKLHMKGAPDHYAVISAMPCEPNTPGAVQRKSGQWYENVVFDDGYRITTPWTRLPENPKIWITQPGYHRVDWRRTSPNNRWEYIYNVRFIDHPVQPEREVFTLAPYMLLQDGEPFLWADRLEDLTGPGIRGYDQECDVLYVWPHENKDPNNCVMESWYGGPDDETKELRHGEGRAFFDGDMEYVSIRGIEFRMFIRLFEFWRHSYEHESQRVVQHYVRFEDNLCRYGWQHLILDGNIVNSKDPRVIGPSFEDRSNWHVRNNVMFRSSKESFQVHGENHVFEYNEIIEHGGPWAGPAAMVSSVNTRNMKNAAVRGNFILGQGTNPWRAGSVFMIETSEEHGDSTGDYIHGDQTFEYNIFARLTQGTAIVAGKGGVRMQNVTIRSNIFYGNEGSEAIRITSPHLNLTIEQNVFVDQRYPIQIIDDQSQGRMTFETLPSTISIRHNIFLDNRETIDRRLLSAPDGSRVIIDRNLFFRNQGPDVGSNAIIGDPLFRNPTGFDFRLQPGSAAITDDAVLGPYGAGGGIPEGTDWWVIKDNPWARASLILSP